MRVEHYANGAMETVDKQETVCANLSGTVDPITIHYLLTALKYFDRMGLKGPVAEDSYKCADYLCRAVTGRWLSEAGGDGDVSE